MRLHALVAASLATLGCADRGCKKEIRTIITSPNAELFVGMSPADLQDAIGGTRSGPMQWLPDGEQLPGFPSPSETEISVTIDGPSMGLRIAWQHTSRFFVRREQCQSLFETEVAIELRSADSVLDTTILAPATFTSFDAPAFDIEIDVTDEDLGFAWGPIDDSRLILALDVDDEGAADGALKLRVDGDETTIATWTLSRYERERP